MDPAAAAQLATTFALDYLSWDEDAPVRRSEALRRYLADGVDTTQGWSGRGRQRAEFASPGEIVPVGYGLGVDVHVRVTLYDRVDTTGPAAEAPQPVFALPAGAIWSSAPPPVAPGWVAGPAVWVRLSVPVRRHDSGRLVVDLSPIPEPDNHAEGRTQ